ncbi:metal ABC transporter solute-binding protein, Zn/Mn family [Helicobacter pametensis]|uniref:metal ABC transporter solute-binding protein, Zn/Mn family n=1 Tax=Helicobacter pametensis TaxID=95149 RepID=UPI000484136B|nr:zinc ABC transporter substrate-binding protein [Helicobacter pametensis]
MLRLCLALLLFCLGYADEFKIKVGVSLSPYAFFVQKIGGPFVKISTIVPPHRNPKFYEPSYEQIKQAKDFKLLILSGIPYEKKWLSRFTHSNPSLQILDFSSKQCTESLCYQWLSFEQAKMIAQKIAHQLRVIDIKNARNYKKNLDAFLQELNAFESKLKEQIQSSPTQVVAIDSQKIWQQLSKELGIKYQMIQDLSSSKIPFCFITPFDHSQKIAAQYHLSHQKLIELNPFSKDWMMLIQSFVQISISGEKYGK